MGQCKLTGFILLCDFDFFTVVHFNLLSYIFLEVGFMADTLFSLDRCL